MAVAASRLLDTNTFSFTFAFATLHADLSSGIKMSLMSQDDDNCSFYSMK